MSQDKEPELQIVEIESDEKLPDIVLEYQILNERLDEILSKIKQRKSETSN